jgi:hypothetical protein
MSDLHEPDDRLLDEQLAEYTDQLLGASAPEQEPELSPDGELRALQETVRQVAHIVGADAPDAAMAERIRSNLKAYWQRTLTPPARAPLARMSFWQRVRQVLFPGSAGWRSSRRGQQVLALRFALAAAVVLMAALFITPSIGTALTSAAGGSDGWIIAALVLGGATLVLGWFVRRRR